MDVGWDPPAVDASGSGAGVDCSVLGAAAVADDVGNAVAVGLGVSAGTGVSVGGEVCVGGGVSVGGTGLGEGVHVAVG